MKYFLTCLLFVSSFSHASMNIKLGLWKVSMKMNADGKEMNPMEQMQKSMAKMSPEKKKMMMEMMGKNKLGIGSDGAMQVCYSKEMLANPESFTKKPDPKCKVSIITNTPSKTVMNMKCDDGTIADVTMLMTDSKNYSSNMNINKNGKKSVMKSTGKFVSVDCGNVKPII